MGLFSAPKKAGVGGAETNGILSRAAEDSCAGMEETARWAEAKGVFWERGPHPHELGLSRWLEEQREDNFFSVEQLRVAPPRATACFGTGSKAGREKVSSNVAGRDEIVAACGRLVACLPDQYRGPVRQDAEALAEMMVRLCPKTPWLVLKLEVVQNNACWRWHQDNYTGRSIVTYVGPGTCAVEDSAVNFDRFRERSNEGLVNEKGVYQMQPNGVLLIKGNLWPGISGLGLTHKSPDYRTENGGPPPKRLILKADLAEERVLS